MVDDPRRGATGPPGARAALPWPRRVRYAGRVLAAAVVSLAVLGTFTFGAGPVPALGKILDPGRGIWASASGGVLPHSQRLTVPGLQHPVTVAYNSQGVPSIQAANDSDLYLAQGYVEASFRLTQMDLDRRLGEGRLAQLTGPSGVSSDQFELQLGLERTAQEEWAQISRSGTVGRELTAYSRGVNDYLGKLRASGDWPSLFTLTGTYPATWTPVDSLVLQEVLTQELDFTATPLDYALLERSLGAARTTAWFPVDPVNIQRPYDPGPYRYAGLTHLAPDAASSAGIAGAQLTSTQTTSTVAAATGRGAAADTPVSAATAQAAGSLLAQINALPAGQVHQAPDSNAWAANGPAVSGGGSMLAGDPHLPLTLPSIWYQVTLDAPGLIVSGTSLPGLPGIVIGHNAHIAWSLTAVQNQSEFFYTEKTSPSHPGEYYWQGRWRPMKQVRYTIDVRGHAPVHLTVDLTVHGSVLTQDGQTVSVDWVGNIPSPDLAVMNNVSRASDFAQFRAALSSWKAPAQNFVYADDAGHIGAIAAGYYPQVAHGDPWLPMPGTGADDITGVIPYQAVPQVYDPPGHVIASANQRPVGASYPYYVGTTARDFFDPGYRADQLYSYLSSHPAMSTSSFAALQNSITDTLATQIKPSLLAALRSDPSLTRTEQTAVRQLGAWDGSMNAQSPAAAIWYQFWSDYLTAVFQPWWNATRVPVVTDRGGLQVSIEQSSLVEDLQQWTRSDPGNAAFTPPGAARRTAPQVMRTAFATAVAQLSSRFGASSPAWSWGKLHTTEIQSLTGAGALGSGPWPGGGDAWTLRDADGYPVSTHGPSWRMIVKWTGRGQAVAEDIYPGGQSENPASPWYTNLLSDWRDGRYLPMPAATRPPARSVRWSLSPGGAHS